MAQRSEQGHGQEPVDLTKAEPDVNEINMDTSAEILVDNGSRRRGQDSSGGRDLWRSGHRGSHSQRGVYRTAPYPTGVSRDTRPSRGSRNIGGLGSRVDHGSTESRELGRHADLGEVKPSFESVPPPSSPPAPPLPLPPASNDSSQGLATNTRDMNEAASTQRIEAAVRRQQAQALNPVLMGELRQYHELWHEKLPSYRREVVLRHIKDCEEMLARTGRPMSAVTNVTLSTPRTRGAGEVMDGNTVRSTPTLSLWFCEAVRAAQFFISCGERLAIVNDSASVSVPCLGFRTGATTDYEERLLSTTTLFPMLEDARSAFPLTWNEKGCWLHHCQDVTVWKGGAEDRLRESERLLVDVLTCPADDLTRDKSAAASVNGFGLEAQSSGHHAPAQRPMDGSLESDDQVNSETYEAFEATAKKRMAGKLAGILRYANHRRIGVVVLPPYGCTKGHPTKAVASMIRDIVLGRNGHHEQFEHIKHVIVAVEQEVGVMSRFQAFRKAFSTPYNDECFAPGSIDIDHDRMLARSMGFWFTHRRVTPQGPWSMENPVCARFMHRHAE